MIISNIPKIELHCHLDGSVRIETLSEFSNLSINEVKKRSMVSSNCNNLNDYLKCFNFINKYLQTESNLYRVSKELCEDLIKDNCIYAEIRFCPKLHTNNGLSLDQVIKSVYNGLNSTNLKTGLIICLMRNFSFEDNKELIDLAYNNKDIVCGIDLAGSEKLYKTESFKELFNYAKKLGLNYTIHAGEADSYKSVDSALSFNSNRIGHGIRAIESNNTINNLIKTNTLIEVCPTSNIQTKVFNNLNDYPIKELFDKGIILNINTDNRTVSNITLTKEYEKCIKTFHFNINDLIKMNKYAILNSFYNNKLDLLNIYKTKLGEFYEKICTINNNDNFINRV